MLKNESVETYIYIITTKYYIKKRKIRDPT